VRLLVDEGWARYPITVDPIAQQAYLQASNITVGGNFGVSVAISGDTVVVGSNGERTGENGQDAPFAGAGLRFCAQRHDLDSAGLSESSQAQGERFVRHLGGDFG